MRITYVSADPPRPEASPLRQDLRSLAARRKLVARYDELALDRDHLEERFALLLEIARARA